MSHFSKTSPRLGTMRRSIACLAARLMAEDGINDYGHAKRKAARQLGAAETEALPTNDEVEEELRAYQALYQGEEQEQRLVALRRTALKAMALLESFKPYLTGPVLDGTAGRHAQVDLDVFTDDAKAVEIFLLGQGLPYDHEPIRALSSNDLPESLLHFELDGTGINLAVHDSLAERHRRRNRHGRIIERARSEAVKALIGDQE